MFLHVVSHSTIKPSMKTSHYKCLSSPLSCFFVSFCRSMENLKSEYLPNHTASNSDVFCRLCKSYFRTLKKINRWVIFVSFVWIKNALAINRDLLIGDLVRKSIFFLEEPVDTPLREIIYLHWKNYKWELKCIQTNLIGHGKAQLGTKWTAFQLTKITQRHVPTNLPPFLQSN